MRHRLKLLTPLLALLAAVLIPSPTQADSLEMGTYTPILDFQGVRFGYRVLPAKRRDDTDEVLLRVINTNAYRVAVTVTISAVSASGKEYRDSGSGFTMRPRSATSGELSGLWYHPFDKGDHVSRLQLVNVSVNRSDRGWSDWQNDTRYPEIQYSLRCGELNGLRFGWYVRFRTDSAQPVHFDFGLNVRGGRQHASGRTTIVPGKVAELSYPFLLPILPEHPDKVQLDVADVRLGVNDEGAYLPPNG